MYNDDLNEYQYTIKLYSLVKYIFNIIHLLQ